VTDPKLNPWQLPTAFEPMRFLSQWIVFRLHARDSNGKYQKLPIDHRSGKVPAKDHGGSEIWTDFPTAAAVAALLGDGHGVGFCFAEADPFWFLDIDGALQSDNTWSDLAKNLCERFPGAAVEVSSSGRGLHIIGTGKAPPHGCKNTAHGIELYTADRWVALTGTGITGSAATDHTQALAALVAEYFPPSASADHAEWITEPRPECNVPGDDQVIIDRMMNDRRPAAIWGSKASFSDLWTANTDALAKFYPSKDSDPYDASSADLALANAVIYHVGGDCARAESIMRQSALVRPKWDRVDYMQDFTILKALSGRKKFHIWPAKVPAGTNSEGMPREAEPLPQALHLATDQRNVDRIIAAYGTRLLSVGGQLYAWSGRHWEPDTGLAQRFAGNLSRIVAEERERAQAQLDEMAKMPEKPDGERYAMLEAIVASLLKWGPKCEMAATQNAALKMLIKAVKIDADKLDANPLLINLENGTYNVETGQLQPHNPLDYITKIAPVKFDPAATCPRFDQFLTEVFDSEPVGDFSMRWFGYCATGETKEQFVVIHWGQGANGKGTLIWKCIAPILGDYAGAGAPGLLTAKNEDQRHPAEIADLFGKRMVTCSESDEGATLREGFVKQASGEDKMKGRFLHGQFFEFNPTHKLQLMTNKKPVVKGTDHGIWRRLLMLPYLNRFGTPAQIAAGEANKPRDNDLDAALRAEWPGILNRIIEGARAYKAGGLAPPPTVLDASVAYRQEQDLVGEYVREELALDINARTDSATLYAHYAAWHGAAGTRPIASKTFLTELEKHVPGFRRSKSNGKRWVHGVTIGQHVPPVPPPPG
jgi:putative DNA primase/helicase